MAKGKGRALKLSCVLLTITVALVASMPGRGEAQPDDPCLDYYCATNYDCLVGNTCCELDKNACGPGLGYCCNPCDYPCFTTAHCKAGWECIGLGTCTFGAGYCWRIETVPVPAPMPAECSDPFFHCSSDAECSEGAGSFICYGFQINLCGPGIGYCTAAA